MSSSADYLALEMIAAWTRSFAERTAQAYSFGVPHGHHASVDSPAFLDAVWRVLQMNLPDEDLADLGRRLSSGANLLVALPLGATSSEDVALVRSFLSGLGKAARRSGTHLKLMRPKMDFDPVSPSILRYELIAALATPASVNRLLRAADAVQFFAHQHVDAPLTDLQLRVLNAVAQGSPVADIAADLGYSSRGLYRELRRIWTRLGADNRSQGLAEAARRGLLGTSS